VDFDLCCACGSVAVALKILCRKYGLLSCRGVWLCGRTHLDDLLLRHDEGNGDVREILDQLAAGALDGHDPRADGDIDVLRHVQDLG
jgi:hypothetical protein